MILFLTVYLGVYGAVNLYFFWQIRRAFGTTSAQSFLLGLFLLTMILSPICIRLLEKADLDWALKPLAYLSYSWMAVVFWFLTLALIRDLINLVAGVTSRGRLEAGAKLPLEGSTMAIFIVILAAVVWGLWEASSIRLEEVTVKTSFLKGEEGSLRLAAISDLHLGLLCGKGKVEKALKLVRKADPDILISVGDLVDGTARCLDDYGPMIRGIEAPLGKYAIVGNHEYYAGLEKSLAFLVESGFLPLVGRSTIVGNKILLVGVDDPAASSVGRPRAKGEDELLPPKIRDKFTVLLKHRPKVRQESLGHFDLMISGHTHGGQVFPFNYLVGLFYTTMDGFYRLGQSSSLYTSRGTGTWGPPFRVLSPPEVTLIKVHPEDQKGPKKMID